MIAVPRVLVRPYHRWRAAEPLVRKAIVGKGFGCQLLARSRLPPCPLFSRYRGMSGLVTDIVKPTRLTQSGSSSYEAVAQGLTAEARRHSSSGAFNRQARP